jgi:hypothetical protein
LVKAALASHASRMLFSPAFSTRPPTPKIFAPSRMVTMRRQRPSPAGSTFMVPSTESLSARAEVTQRHS